MQHTCLNCRLIMGSVRLTRRVCSLWPVMTFQMPMVCGSSERRVYDMWLCGGVGGPREVDGSAASKYIPCPLRLCK